MYVFCENSGSAMTISYMGSNTKQSNKNKVAEKNKQQIAK